MATRNEAVGHNNTAGGTEILRAARTSERRSMAEKKKPAYEARLGRIRVTIWPNQTGDSDTWFNVTISRLYKDDDGWQDATSYRRDDLPIVMKALDMAYDWIWRRQLTDSDSIEN